MNCGRESLEEGAGPPTPPAPPAPLQEEPWPGSWRVGELVRAGSMAAAIDEPLALSLLEEEAA